jgi:hypothetical protein
MDINKCDILSAIIDQPCSLAAYWFGTNSDKASATTTRYATQTNVDLLVQTTGSGISILVSDSLKIILASSQSGHRNRQIKADTKIKHNLLCLAYTAYLRLPRLYYEEIILQKF